MYVHLVPRLFVLSYNNLRFAWPHTFSFASHTHLYVKGQSSSVHSDEKWLRVVLSYLVHLLDTRNAKVNLFLYPSHLKTVRYSAYVSLYS